MTNSEFVIENGKLLKYLGKSEIVEIPDEVIKIAKGAFKGCSSLQKISLPKNLKEIPPSMFEGCGKLSSINIPDGVVKIGDRAFDSCKSLDDVIIPNSVTTLGSKVFHGCFFLRDIKLSDNLIEMGHEVFGNCYNLEKITIPGSLKKLSTSTFLGCRSLNSVVLVNGIQVVGGFIFAGCSRITNIAFPESVSKISSNAFHAGVEMIGNIGLHHDAPHSLRSVVIPNKALVNGLIDFEGCERLNDVEGLTAIRGSTFTCVMGGTEDSLLESVKSVTALGESDFVLYAPSDSVAAKYATENNIPFVETPKAKYVTMLLKKDDKERIKQFASKYKLPKAFFEEVFLKPAQEVKAKECIEFLQNWRTENY